MAACPSDVGPNAKEMVWSDLYASLWLTANRVECTGSLSTSEFKQHRTRLILGWGTAREVLRALSAVAIVIMAALPRFATPKTKEMAWSDLFASWSLTGKQCRPYRDERIGSLSTSEGKLRRARSVLGLGTAREVLKMPSCVAIVITAALPSVVEPDTKETV